MTSQDPRSTSPAAAQFNNISRTSCSNKASIKASAMPAAVLNQKQTIFHLPTMQPQQHSFFLSLSRRLLSFTWPAAFSLSANEIKSSLIKIPVDIFTPRDYALLLFFSAHIHTQARRTRDWLCVFCTLHIHTDTHTTQKRTWQLATESELFSRLKTQHAALHLHCRNCTPLFLSFPTHTHGSRRFKNTAQPRIVRNSSARRNRVEMCRLIEAD
jgi:hypothetical protein